jgi:hypothetical protein
MPGAGEPAQADAYTHRKSLPIIPGHINHILSILLPPRNFIDPTRSGKPRWKVLEHWDHVL